MVEAPYSLVGGYNAMNELFKAPVQPTALFVSSLLVAIGTLKACNKHNIRVPNDLSIVTLQDAEIATMMTSNDCKTTLFTRWEEPQLNS